MAILNRKQQFVGLIGPVYTRNLNGKPIMQPRPVNPKQSKATRASSADFRYAVDQSKAIKNELRPLLQVGTDPYASQRLTGALHKAFHFTQANEVHATLFSADLSALVGFEFHRDTPLQKFLPMTLPFSITQSGTMQLPTVALAPILSQLVPFRYLGAELALMVIGFSAEAEKTVSKEVFGFALEERLPTTLSIETQSFATGTRIIVAAQLLLWDTRTVLGAKNYCNSKVFNPVQVMFSGVV
ncbi:hypothetical protein QWY90_03925 [Flavobacterium paronense]|uniref:Uncharacterized protein n=1 Tax=Flavobacterium paronense TaxID=1392775 RepID=A0ABV5GHF3_9FLAO|nr:hypothetical protein [Flavobacterium paronense]MDN3676453.1 hypothetical protein [Flavobacterium paronense]